MLKKIILVFFAVLTVAFVIQAMPVILAIIYFAFVLIWSLITGESIWGEYGPFW